MMHVPDTERATLEAVLRQAESDLKSAHEQICTLQGVDAVSHTWPAWTPQANSLRWFEAIRAKFNLSR